MSTVSIKEAHSLGKDAAIRALDQFDADIRKRGLRLDWSGDRADIKGTGASGEVVVTDQEVRVVVKLGMLAKVAGIDPKRLEESIGKRLKAALGS